MGDPQLRIVQAFQAFQEDIVVFKEGFSKKDCFLAPAPRNKLKLKTENLLDSTKR